MAIASAQLKSVVLVLRNEVFLRFVAFILYSLSELFVFSTYEGELENLSISMEDMSRRDTYFSIYRNLLSKVELTRKAAAGL
jgi:hypothetical protein